MIMKKIGKILFLLCLSTFISCSPDSENEMSELILYTFGDLEDKYNSELIECVHPIKVQNDTIDYIVYQKIKFIDATKADLEYENINLKEMATQKGINLNSHLGVMDLLNGYFIKNNEGAINSKYFSKESDLEGLNCEDYIIEKGKDNYFIFDSKGELTGLKNVYENITEMNEAISEYVKNVNKNSKVIIFFNPPIKKKETKLEPILLITQTPSEKEYSNNTVVTFSSSNIESNGLHWKINGKKQGKFNSELEFDLKKNGKYEISLCNDDTCVSKFIELKKTPKIEPGNTTTTTQPQVYICPETLNPVASYNSEKGQLRCDNIPEGDYRFYISTYNDKNCLNYVENTSAVPLGKNSTYPVSEDHYKKVKSLQREANLYFRYSVECKNGKKIYSSDCIGRFRYSCSDESAKCKLIR